VRIATELAAFAIAADQFRQMNRPDSPSMCAAGNSLSEMASCLLR